MNIKKVVIVGGGSAGWMTAAALVRRFPGKQLDITLIESDVIGAVGVGESTIPPIRQFNEFLGIDELAFVRETKATFKLGIRFLNWGELGGDYIHPFGSVGQDFAGIDFHHYWRRARSIGNKVPFDQYSLAAVAARQGRFQFPERDHPLLSSFNYSYHFDATLYATFLRRYAETRGVIRREGVVNSVLKKSSSGFIEIIGLESGEKISADLFIDCSGFRALLMKDVGAQFESWKQWLRCDNAIVAPSEKAMLIPQPYTQSTAKSVGWQWSIPLQHRVGNGYVYASDYISHADAVRIFCEDVTGKLLAEPRRISFSAGQYKNNWEKNCVAIGLSGGFLEPLESTSIYLIQYAIQKLIEYFPESGAFDTNAFEFNKQLNKEYIRLRDFIIMHYKEVNREDSTFWRDCKNMTVPDELAARQMAFSCAGIVDHSQYGVYAAVCIGQGLIPKYHDIKINRLSDAQLMRALNEVYKQVTEGSALMQNADKFIDSLIGEHRK
ncbi:tryptophan halogenase family protein [Cellvibrio mixtus]|uniref:tryptophan halogenase family protein n=1 Tax=Cellvibrio mixtus TaxID=39650 RepID=UPI000586AF94|nr:tryptophan halogenase family protein [Cellvibrio mixtus]